MALTLISCFRSESQNPTLAKWQEQIEIGVPDLSLVDLLPGEVEFDLFSGRPNPTWLLSKTEMASLQEKLSGLSTVAPFLPPEQLGYRGIRVNLADAESRTRSAILIYHGGIIHWSGNTVSYYEDKGKQLEHWLVEMSKSHIDADLYAVMVTEITK